MAESQELKNCECAYCRGKKLFKSKNFWAAIVLFLLSLLTVVGTMPFLTDPRWQGVLGMAFAVLWVLLRMVTDKPIDPTINLPNPKDWGTTKK